MGKQLVLLDGTRCDTAIIDVALQADYIARDLGLNDGCRVALRRIGYNGICLVGVNQKLQKAHRQGLLKGAGGVYITHEQNPVKGHVYHRVRLNVCAGGRRFRRDLGSYRVK